MARGTFGFHITARAILVHMFVQTLSKSESHLDNVCTNLAYVQALTELKLRVRLLYSKVLLAIGFNLAWTQEPVCVRPLDLNAVARELVVEL